MEIVYNDNELETYMSEAVKVSNESPVLLDHFLNKAIEVDVDAVSDGKQVIIGGIMEHIEQAGVHSGDSSCSIPAYSLSDEIQEEIIRQMIQFIENRFSDFGFDRADLRFESQIEVNACINNSDPAASIDEHARHGLTPQ